jgi:chloramphenicol 3-O-phosphotransferase
VVSPIVIVSGCPGAGKSTLARALSRAAVRGLHLDSDWFYGFPAAPIDPATPEAHDQNTIVMRALARSAGAFAEGGYAVFLDGVIGPWFLPLLRDELRGARLAYLVLRASEEDALRRVRARDGGGASARVRHMHAAFAKLGPYHAHAIETSGRRRRDVLAEARDGLRAGRFDLAPP